MNIIKGAILSDCGKYRFQLWRIWDDTLEKVLFIMHNPSTADACTDDRTIGRCVDYAMQWGYGGIYVGNLYPYRSKDPEILKTLTRQQRHHDPENFKNVKEMYDKCSLRILAFGNPIIKNETPFDFKGTFHYLKLTKVGNPCHPLYLKGDLKPVEMKHE